MSDTTTYPPAGQPFPGSSNPVRAPAAAPPKPVASPSAPKEPTIKDRASGLLAAMKDSQKHNAPITPWMLSELAAVVGQVTGEKAPAPLHQTLDMRGSPTIILVRKPDGAPLMVESAEEALAYVRSLPKDVQARPYWVAADKALSDAVASVPGSDISPAIRQFQAALAEDRKLDAKPVEIKDKPADDTAAKNMEAQRQAQAKAEADARAKAAAAPAPAPAV